MVEKSICTYSCVYHLRVFMEVPKSTWGNLAGGTLSIDPHISQSSPYFFFFLTVLRISSSSEVFEVYWVGERVVEHPARWSICISSYNILFKSFPMKQAN